MRNFSFLLSVCAFSLTVIAVQNELVITKNGGVRGKEHENWISWERIPYAQPPTGENRFEPPQPVQNWVDVKDATDIGNICLQWDHFIFEGNRLSGNEDCLYLNIYRSRQPSNLDKLPVIFYIHGGAFQFGQGHFYGPRILMKQPLILVTINYRLGPLGFLSTQDENIPGNMGLKDQTMALKWVHENIGAFGGDSNKITITGYSAGGASVHLHYLTNLSRGLFQNGISHSGSALNPWVFMENPVEKTKQLALNVGCSIESTKIIKECLKQKSANKIVESVAIFQPWLYNPFSPFGAVVEPIDSDNAFITQTPEELLRSGNFNQIPWLVSATEDEGYYPAGEFLRKQSYLDDLNVNWTDIAPFILHMNDTIPHLEQAQVMNAIRYEYFGEKEINEATLPYLVDMITDHMYLGGIQRSVKLQSQNSKAPVYFYYYRFDAEFGVDHAFALRNDIKGGVAHGDDVLLIYDTFVRGLVHPYNEEELKVQMELINLYYSYAAYGSSLSLAGIEFQEAKVNDELEADNKRIRFLEFLNYNNASIVIDYDIANENFWKQYPFN